MIYQRQHPFTLDAERSVQAVQNCYNLFGLSVASAIPLPLPAAAGPAIIEVVEGPVANGGSVLFQTDDPLPFSCMRQGEDIVLAWTGIRFSVSRHRVVIDADDLSMAIHLLVPAAWSVVLSAHEREALHGAAVAHGGNTAIAILGDSGSGKTTAAAGLIERGWQLVSDDLLTFDEGFRVLPGPPWVRFLAGAANASSEPDRGGKVRVRHQTGAVPVPLSAVVVLAEQHTQCVRLAGTSAVAALLQQIYTPLLTHPGQAQRRFDLISGLAARVPVYGAPPRSLSAGHLLHILEETRA